jgi:RNA polymerase sigma factor (sigma-70 family)
MHFGGEKLTNIELVSEAKMGNKKAFEKLYEDIFKDMYRYALYMLGNSHDAEDIVSDTTLDVYKSLYLLKKEESFKAWVFRILYIKCKNKRKEYIDKTVLLDDKTEIISLYNIV